MNIMMLDLYIACNWAGWVRTVTIVQSAQKVD